MPHEASPLCRQTFEAELESGALAHTQLILFRNSPMQISHKGGRSADTQTDDLFICRQASGKLNVEQYGREAILTPGDLVLLDARIAYSGAFCPGSQLLVLKVPRALLESRAGPARELAGYVLKPLQGEAALVSSYIAQLPLHEGSLSPQAKEIVEQQVLDLLAVALAKLTSGEGPRLSSARSLVRTMIGSAIEAHLTDLQLEPETIAAAVGVSVRYANSVLAQENTSIMRLLWFRRLERCRKALEDPSLARRMVSEIAYSCGFSDMTHFGRKFKATYGSSPRDYRRRWMDEHPPELPA